MISALVAPVRWPSPLSHCHCSFRSAATQHEVLRAVFQEYRDSQKADAPSQEEADAEMVRSYLQGPHLVMPDRKSEEVVQMYVDGRATTQRS